MQKKYKPLNAAQLYHIQDPSMLHRICLGISIVLFLVSQGCSPANKIDVPAVVETKQAETVAAAKDEREVRKEILPEVTEPSTAESSTKADDGQRRNMASDLLQMAMFQLVAQTEEGREPYFASTNSGHGLRIQSNLTGRRYAFELTGIDVVAEKPEWKSWNVDGTSITLEFDPNLVAPSEVPIEQGIQSIVDAILPTFTEKRQFQLDSRAAELVKTRTGETAWYGQLYNKAEAAPENKREVGCVHLGVASLRSGALLAIIVAPLNDRNAQKKRELLKSTLLSIETLPDLPKDRAPVTAEDLIDKGLNMKQHIRLAEYMTNETCGVLLNDDLASAMDRKTERASVLQSHQLLECLSAYFRAQDEKQDLSVSVFDGHTSHTVNLLKFEPQSGDFVFWDPWGQGSFLQRGNNRAGVQARQDADNERHFRVTSEELQRVAYYALFSKDDLDAVVRYSRAPKNTTGAQSNALLALGHDLRLNVLIGRLAKAEKDFREKPDQLEAARAVCEHLDILGDFHFDRWKQDDPSIALEYFSRSLQLRQQADRENHDSIECADAVMISHFKLGQTYEKQESYQSALANYRSGLRIIDERLSGRTDSELLTRNKGIFGQRMTICNLALATPDQVQDLIDAVQPVDRARLWSHVATVFAKRRELATVKLAGDRLRELAEQSVEESAIAPEPKWNILYNAACAYSLSSGLVQTATKTQNSEQDRKKYLDMAISCLRESIKAGWDNYEHLQADPDLLPLHNMPEFKALIPTQ